MRKKWTRLLVMRRRIVSSALLGWKTRLWSARKPRNGGIMMTRKMPKSKQACLPGDDSFMHLYVRTLFLSPHCNHCRCCYCVCFQRLKHPAGDVDTRLITNDGDNGYGRPSKRCVGN